ncbi:hypothetical protein EOB59_28880 [Mesorhizobium sp. M7A.F.Ca.MR.176.00.0.0]|uniref:hypothetical protein n=1 Tax=Mesorhizobium sp. M7A.F.Ca.MR.176.00.0.0 TaxID=2496776 RepID=UPI000FD5711A|nr:hypothetical protein [Mesorhizobium sp. M7A.F.Ca.MR.176.00.0.0]RUU86448.1 hypothetical protein EOB59_28880 [Mesorhizobium sp. M7A.F.Ca.MR.176.00.0.0]
MTGGNAGDSDGGFIGEPVVTTTASGNTTVKGQTKPGSFGKFVYPLATIAAARQYTFRTVASFSQLAQQGKLAMVGFGLKNGNDFHIAGLRGDGSTGCKAYEVYGTPPNGWNKDTGHTTVDSGAPAHGTQYAAYHRLTTSADGATADYSTSDDGVTWVEELSDFSLTPFTNVSGVLTFGIALWFSNADAGPFSIVIDQFADAAAPSGPTVTYIGTFTDATTTDPHTFTANVGAAGTKLVVVCPHSLRNAAAQRTIVSVSIDGTNGTLAGQNGVNDGVNEGTQTGIAYREISTGGTITIIDDWSALHSFSAADVYTITGHTSNVHVDVKTATGNDPTISTLSVSANGCVIASASGVEPATGAFTFSGVSLDHEQQCDSSNGIVHMREAAGHATGLAATSTYNVQASSAAGFEVVAAISFV